MIMSYGLCFSVEAWVALEWEPFAFQDCLAHYRKVTICGLLVLNAGNIYWQPVVQPEAFSHNSNFLSQRGRVAFHAKNY